MPICARRSKASVSPYTFAGTPIGIPWARLWPRRPCSHLWTRNLNHFGSPVLSPSLAAARATCMKCSTPPGMLRTGTQDLTGNLPLPMSASQEAPMISALRRKTLPKPVPCSCFGIPLATASTPSWQKSMAAPYFPGPCPGSWRCWTSPERTRWSLNWWNATSVT